MESVQAVLILAMAALILSGMQAVWSPPAGNGLESRVEYVIEEVINGRQLVLNNQQAQVPEDGERESSPGSISLVDYLESQQIPASFESREGQFAQFWPDAEYEGSASQNRDLLNQILKSRKQIRIPVPSSDVGKCEEFYSHPEVSKYMTKAFEANAISACIVTGSTRDAHNKIRFSLQKQYLEAKPANGEVFTPREHKEIHDKAYKEAGCNSGSANILGWHIVDIQDWPDSVIDWSIWLFGHCTVAAE